MPNEEHPMPTVREHNQAVITRMSQIARFRTGVMCNKCPGTEMLFDEEGERPRERLVFCPLCEIREMMLNDIKE